RGRRDRRRDYSKRTKPHHRRPRHWRTPPLGRVAAAFKHGISFPSTGPRVLPTYRRTCWKAVREGGGAASVFGRWAGAGRPQATPPSVRTTRLATAGLGCSFTRQRTSIGRPA